MRTLLAALAVTVLGAIPSLAQEVTGTPGAPDATTTIDGRQLQIGRAHV